MAKKGGKSSGRVSNGERPNVSRWARNAMRRDRRLEFDVKGQAVSAKVKKFCKDKILRARYDAEETALNVAAELFNRYNKVATWAACCQAAKTGWVSQFHSKYGPKLKKA